MFGAFHERLAAQRILSADRRFLQIELDVSNKCNLRCRMCYFSYDEMFFGAPVFFPPARFEQLGDEVLVHTHTLTLALGSEPLTSPHFVRILELAARRGVPNLTFYTNGLLLKPEIIDAIISHGVTQICLSLDGATRETYEYIRRGASFDRLMANITALVAARERARRTLPVLRFDVVLMRRNIEEVPAIIRLAHRLGVAQVNLFHLVPYEHLGMEEESLVHDKKRSNACLAEAHETARALGIEIVSAPAPFNGGSATAAVPFEQEPYCRYPFFHVSINAGGWVLACPFSHGVEPFGRIDADTTLADVWFNEAFTGLRARILANDPPAMCRRCSFLATRHPDVAELFLVRKPIAGLA